MKVCTKCGEEKIIEEFHKDKSKADGRREQCKDCRCKLPKQVTKNCIACGDFFIVDGNRKAQKYCGSRCQKVHIRYGIDEYKHEDLLISSDFKCMICGQPESSIDKRTGKVYELSIDHCHETGNVRGVLCTGCNTGLGSFKDNTDLLYKAIDYLKRSKE